MQPAGFTILRLQSSILHSFLLLLYDQSARLHITMRWLTEKQSHSIMETTRQSKINRLLQKELSETFRQQTALMHGTLITVSTVRVSPDLSIAKVYLSVFPSDQGEEILKSIRKSSASIRYELAQRVRFQLRKIPEFTFFIDDSLDYLETIDNLLRK